MHTGRVVADPVALAEAYCTAAGTVRVAGSSDYSAEHIRAVGSPEAAAARIGMEGLPLGLQAGIPADWETGSTAQVEDSC